MTIIVIGEPVDVEVAIPPTLVISVEPPQIPVVTVLYPNTVISVESPPIPEVLIPALPGPEGPSAYDVAVSEGFIGDEEAWLASLVGEKGDDGLSGTTGGSFIFIQPVAALTWDIVHDLTYTPNVLVVDTAGTVMIGDVIVLTPTHLTISFSIPVLGFAYLS